jgi:uncharacterized protein YoxC
MLLTLSTFLLAAFAVPLFLQAQQTMNAYAKLANTLNSEVPSTLHEFKELAERVNMLGSATTQQITDVGHKVEEVSGSIGQAAGQAKRESSVWGSALMAGVKAYLSGRVEESENGQAASEARRISRDGGEQNVRK